jgi:hypothetical protein
LEVRFDREGVGTFQRERLSDIAGEERRAADSAVLI